MNRPEEKQGTAAIDILLAENAKASAYVEQLKSASRCIQANGFSFETFEQIVEAMRYIDSECRQHCVYVEHYVLPLVERHVPGVLQEALEEHKAIWKALAVLRECVKDIEDLRIHSAIIRDLAQYSTTIADLLSRQIERENTVLYPSVKELLTPEECEQLRSSICAAHPSESIH